MKTFVAFPVFKIFNVCILRGGVDVELIFRREDTRYLLRWMRNFKVSGATLQALHRFERASEIKSSKQRSLAQNENQKRYSKIARAIRPEIFT
jgi:hypothetical protein